MKIKGVIEDLKIKIIKEKKRMIIKIVKIYVGLSLVVLWAVWGQFIFIVPWSGLYFSRSIGPFLCSQY